MADASRDLTAELVKLVQAMQEIKAEEDSRVNSYEIFVNQKQTHIRNSRGVDVTFSGFDCEIEVVTNSRKDHRRSARNVPHRPPASECCSDPPE